ncbi:MAG: aminotransferase class I/II-fold pyridoxal phosphate-dependent enzyme [Candidatus Kryptoniota bacterium]
MKKINAKPKAKQKKSRLSNDYSMETHLIYGKSHTEKWDYSHHLVPPITASATFRLESAQRGAQGFVEFAHTYQGKEISKQAPIYIYDRLGEPNKDLLEENLAMSESGGTCVTFASGMGAVSAALGILTAPGNQIISHKMLYGCTYELLTLWYPRYNIDVKFIDLTNPKSLEHAITPATRVVYFETPVNPTLDLIDIEAVSKIIETENKRRNKQSRISVVVDNTFATPFCQRPIELGADFVVHSLTKNIGGFGTDVGGAVVGPLWSRDQLLLYRKDFGAVLGTRNAWDALVYGLPTLSTRVRHQQETAAEVARFLSGHSEIEFVNYPGLEEFKHHGLAKKQMHDFDGNFAPGSMIYFAVKGNSPEKSRSRGEKLINFLAKNAYTITLAVSLGNIRTLVEHPGSMTHAAIPAAEQMKKGIDPGGMRLSIGLEKVDDILRDLQEALNQI